MLEHDQLKALAREIAGAHDDNQLDMVEYQLLLACLNVVDDILVRRQASMQDIEELTGAINNYLT